MYTHIMEHSTPIKKNDLDSCKLIGKYMRVFFKVEYYCIHPTVESIHTDVMKISRIDKKE